VIRDELFNLAETLEGPSVQAVAGMAKETGKHIIFGMAERSQELRGQLYNSAVLAYPDGSVDVYRKLHTITFGPFEEAMYFVPGNRLGLFRLPGLNLGVMICYDVFFPELSKLYAMRGVDAIVNISASPSVTKKFFELVIPARAVEDTVFYLYTNLVGTENNMVFWGGAQAYGPRGGLLGKGPYFEDAAVTVEIDPGELDVARRFRTTLRDTRTDVLEELAGATAMTRLEP